MSTKETLQTDEQNKTLRSRLDAAEKELAKWKASSKDLDEENKSQSRA